LTAKVRKIIKNKKLSIINYQLSIKIITFAPDLCTNIKKKQE